MLPQRTKKDLSREFLRRLKGKKLYPPLNNYSVFIQGSEYNSKRYFKKWGRGEVRPDMLVIMNASKWQACLPNDDVLKTTELGFLEYFLEQKKFKERMQCFHKNRKDIDAFYKKYTYKKIQKSDWESLLQVARKVRDLMWDANAAAWYCIVVDKEICQSFIKKYAIGISEIQFESLWERAIEPLFQSFDVVQADEFLSWVKQKKNWTEIVEQCQYFLTDYHSGKTLDFVGKELKKRYQKILRNPESVLRERFLAKKDLRRKQKYSLDWRNSLSKQEGILVEYLQHLMETRDQRKNFFAKGWTILYRIAERMFSEAGVNRDCIPYCTFKEFLEGVPYIASLQKEFTLRKEGFQVLNTYEGKTMISLYPVERAFLRVGKYYFGNLAQRKGVRGQTACPGIVRGRVRVILNAFEAQGFQKGDILVTGMTRPEFVSLMKKSSAIITDEGGITCHAAIVSRELQIPCIIGTKNATQILKDGMMVVVDATQGRVMIIKNSYKGESKK